MEPNWTVRNYRQGDEKRIVDLWNIIYGDIFSYEYWDWKFRLNPAGFKPENTIVAETPEGEIVAGFALMPLKTRVGDAEVTVTQGADLVTHPDYQRQGLFRTLATQLYDLAGKAGLPWTYAYPDIETAAYEGHMKMGWADVLHVNQMTCVLNPRAFVLRREMSGVKKYAMRKYIGTVHKPKPPHPEKGVKVEEVEAYGPGLDEFWSDVAGDYPVALKRDSAYLNWRAAHPSGSYVRIQAGRNGDVDGYAVLARRDRAGMKQGYILDCVTRTGERECVNGLMDWIFHWAEKEKLDALRFWVPEWHRYNRLFRMFGFFSKPTKIALILRKNSEEEMTEDAALFDGKQWFYSMLDTDHI